MLKLSLGLVSLAFAGCHLGSSSEWLDDRKLSDAVESILKDSTSVKLREYRWFSVVTNKNRELLAEKTLTAEDVKQVSACFSPGGELSRWRCIFEPHHQLVCTEKNGTETVIRICFHCDQIGFEDGGYSGMGPLWKERLMDLFQKFGMPVRPKLYKVEHRTD